MKPFIKRIVPQVLLDFNSFLYYKDEFSSFMKNKPIYETIKQWVDSGEDAPAPHIVKQKTIQRYQKEYSLNTLVETGTYMGDMIKAQLPFFEVLYSIELSEELHQKALKRFESTDSNSGKVVLLQGDSGEIISDILPRFSTPVLFWLDGHFSAGETAQGDLNTPIIEELNKIFLTSINHIILIDDARCFIGANDYPTIDSLCQFVSEHASHYQVEVGNDIIRLVPKK